MDFGNSHLEVADVVLVLVDCDVGRLGHELRALQVLVQPALLADEEDGGRDAVDGDDVPAAGDGQAGHNVDEADGDPKEEVAAGVEDLHPGSLAASVADDKGAGGAEDGDLARVPQAALLLASHAEQVAQEAVCVENLQQIQAIHENIHCV